MSGRLADPNTGPGAQRLDLHRRVGLEAVARGYVDIGRLAEAMTVVGAAPEASFAEVWVHSGALDRTELAEILAHVDALSGTARPVPENVPRSTFHQTPVAQSAVDDPGASINLADVIRTYTGPKKDGDDGANQNGANQNGAIQNEANKNEAPTAAFDAADTRRYLLGAELGRGGVGRVLRAFDRDLGRSVALKVPLQWPLREADVQKFVEEAQATGQLEHPNIVPVYDIGRLDSGELYYTMKRVRAYSLRDVIEGLIAHDPAILDEYGTTRLLSTFLQVCLAVHYAHVKGVIHRDLKPDNIMLGEFGEVHVMDWGLARIMDRLVVTDRSLSGGHKSEIGQTVGTPAYMPPEQARGQLDAVDERSDVYSLGAILYELVTLKQPSTRRNVMATLMAVISEPVPPPSTVSDAAIAEEMEHIIMRALEKEPGDRYASAKELHDAVEKFMDGRNDREANRRVLEGERFVRLYEHWRNRMLELKEQVHEANSKIEEWQSIDVKRQIWDLEDQHRNSAMQMVTAFGDANRQFTQALAHVPDHPEARAALARLFFSRYELAELEENELDKVYYRSQIEAYDDGVFTHRLQDSAPVSIYTNPPGAAVFLYALREADRRMVVGPPEFLGEAPVPERLVNAGSYQVKVKHPAHPAVQIPLGVSRSDPQAVEIRIPAERDYQPGFVFVAGGVSLIGGDPEAFDPLPQQRVEVASFFLQRHPVTFGEYVSFLDALAELDPEEAWDRAPRTRGSEGALVTTDEDGRFVPADVLIEGDMRARYPDGEGYEATLPVLAVRYDDALAYCRWRSARDGAPYRLPTELEWERACRGADGRFYPWGSRFDANFCKMAASRAIESQPEPVGAFSYDRSPFDVFDLAGGVREWVDSPDDDTYAVVRGGYWAGDARSCRASSRWRFHRGARLATIGFRLAYSLP